MDREALVRELVDSLARERTLIGRLTEQSALLELAPDPIFACDAQHLITFWNHAAELAYGFTREEAIGCRPLELLRSESPVEFEEIERLVSENGSWEGDLVHTSKDGREFTVASRWGAVCLGDGQPAGLLGVNRDITERLEDQAEQERSRARLDRAQLSDRLVHTQRLESLGQLAGGIAHDFNNLLAVITSYSEVALASLGESRDRLGDERFRSLTDDVAHITQASGRAAGLTQQLLAFAQQEIVRSDVIDINAAITEMLELLRRTLGEHIQLAVSLDPDLHRVRIDPGQLGQILVNLAVNSRSAMPSGGRLSIKTSRVQLDDYQTGSQIVLPSGPYIRLVLSDTGVGMSQAVIERAFDPFFSTRAVGEGSGLGLATVFGITTQAGGQVELASEPGHGTTVTVLLPASEAPLAAANPPPAAASVPAGGARTILIVEDELALLQITARILTSAGYLVFSASRSEDALALAQGSEQPIDLLLTDVVMPELLGPQLAEQLTAARPSMKVLFMSGFARLPHEQTTEPLQGPLLQKPFTSATLLTGIAQALQDHQTPSSIPASH